MLTLGRHRSKVIGYDAASANIEGGSVRYFSRYLRERWIGATLSASSSFLVAIAFLLIGLWSGQAVFFFMAISVLVISLGEILNMRRPDSALTILWIGRACMLAAILYVLVFLLPAT